MTIIRKKSRLSMPDSLPLRCKNPELTAPLSPLILHFAQVALRNGQPGTPKLWPRSFTLKMYVLCIFTYYSYSLYL